MIILCQNCLRLIKEKMHQSNIEQNCLTLENIPDELDLVDLEQQLIARSLLFIKAKKKIPRAQLRAMKDKLINVTLKMIM